MVFKSEVERQIIFDVRFLFSVKRRLEYDLDYVIFVLEELMDFSIKFVQELSFR